MIKSQTTNKSTWIALRSNSNLHGKLEAATMRLEVIQRGFLVIYDLKATAETGKAVVIETRQIERK